MQQPAPKVVRARSMVPRPFLSVGRSREYPALSLKLDSVGWEPPLSETQAEPTCAAGLFISVGSGKKFALLRDAQRAILVR
jgi:hypothetical protein